MDSYYWYERWLAAQDEEFARLSEEQKEYWESLYDEQNGDNEYGQEND